MNDEIETLVTLKYELISEANWFNNDVWTYVKENYPIEVDNMTFDRWCNCIDITNGFHDTTLAERRIIFNKCLFQSLCEYEEGIINNE